MHSRIGLLDILYVFCVVRNSKLSHFLEPNWIWREKHSTLYVKAQFRPNMSNSIRSTYVSPQLEANTIIPVRQYAVSVRVEPPPS